MANTVVEAPFCYGSIHNKMKLGKVEKKILKALALPYPNQTGAPSVFCNPNSGSDLKHLMGIVFPGSGRYAEGKEEVSVSRALMMLNRKGLVLRYRPWQITGMEAMWDDGGKPKIRELPSCTKLWWLLSPRGKEILLERNLTEEVTT